MALSFKIKFLDSYSFFVGESKKFLTGKFMICHFCKEEG